MKTILFCTDGSPAAAGAGRYALWLAGKFHAKIVTLHVTDIRLLEGPLLADLAGALGAQPYPALLARVREMQNDRARTLLDDMAQRCREQGVACEGRHVTGTLIHSILECERDADLVVIGRQGEHAAWQPDLLGSCVERLVRASTKPCLVVPEVFREFRHLLLAHDGSGESLKALQQGLNLAVALDASVTVVTACERAEEDAGSLVLQRAHDLARARNLDVHAQLVHENAETAILELAGERSADLIVMGAYGHTRIREWVLGSTTTHVLQKTRLPVWLARGS